MKNFCGNIIESHRGVSDIVETYTRFGDVVIPHLDSMVDQMKKVVNDFDSQSSIFYNQISEVTKEYSWQSKTNQALDALVARVGRDMFENSGYFS